MAIPPPEPERPAAAGPGDWVRHNLFRSVGDGIVTVVSGLVVLYVVYRAVRYVFVTGRWEIVRGQPQAVHGRSVPERRAVADLGRHRR